MRNYFDKMGEVQSVSIISLPLSMDTQAVIKAAEDFYSLCQDKSDHNGQRGRYL